MPNIERYPENMIDLSRFFGLPPHVREWAVQDFREGGFSVEQLKDADYVVEEYYTCQTAEHEESHAAVASALGWGVVSKSVIKDGNTLGVTKVSPPAGGDELELLEQNVAILVAGKVGEKMCNNPDHGGCGSDFSKAKSVASYIAAKRGGSYSQENIIANAESRAYGALQGIGGQTELKGRARILRRVRQS